MEGFFCAFCHLGEGVVVSLVEYVVVGDEIVFVIYGGLEVVADFYDVHFQG